MPHVTRIGYRCAFYRKVHQKLRNKSCKQTTVSFSSGNGVNESLFSGAYIAIVPARSPRVARRDGPLCSKDGTEIQRINSFAACHSNMTEGGQSSFMQKMTLS